MNQKVLHQPQISCFPGLRLPSLQTEKCMLAVEATWSGVFLLQQLELTNTLCQWR